MKSCDSNIGIFDLLWCLHIDQDHPSTPSTMASRFTHEWVVVGQGSEAEILLFLQSTKVLLVSRPLACRDGQTINSGRGRSRRQSGSFTTPRCQHCVGHSILMGSPLRRAPTQG